MEADLGIDSIKRVEILSAMKEEIAGLPEVDAAELSKTQTLAEIVGIYEPLLASSSNASAAPASAGNGGDIDALRGVLLKVVADKTGYPADMLDLSMNMEADLGIDSIKRVEILSAMKEEIAGLPEVDAAELSKTQTLAEIVGIYEPLLGGNDNNNDPNNGGPNNNDPHGGGGTAPAPASASKKAPQVGRFVTELKDAPPTGFALKGWSTAKRVTILPDDKGVAQALAGLLEKAGKIVEVAALPNAQTEVLLVLSGLRAVPDVQTARAIQREAFHAARAFARSNTGTAFVTVQDTGGTFGLEGADRLGARAWIGGLPGLVKTAALEWQGVSCRAIDLATEGRDANVLAQRLLAELVGGGEEVEVALRGDSTRQTLVVREETVSPGSRPIAPGSVIVASGGARGVTASSLIALAAATQCKLVLLGRTPLSAEDPALKDAAEDAALKRLLMEAARAAGEKITPAEIGRRARRVLAGREIRATLEAITAAGGQARYEATDVQDVEKLRATLDAVRKEWGPIAGIVHGAGVLADKRIEDKSDNDFDRVFDTKVLGLDALLRACAEDPIELLCSFSSVAGRAGNVGQSDYAMANEVHNKVTASEGASRRARGMNFTAKSIGWGPWEGGMVTPALKAHFESMGVPLIPIQGGATAFVNELAAPGDVEIVVGASPEAWQGKARSAETTYEVVVDRAHYPILDGHRVKGEVVIPVVLVLEWFTRAASLHRAGTNERVVRCSGVQVLSGLKLDGFDTGVAHTFTIIAKTAVAKTTDPVGSKTGDGATIALELRDPTGRTRYRATAGSLPSDKQPPAPQSGDVGSLAPLGGKIYGDVLFHGSEFQVIRGVDGVGENGAAATMIGARTMGWPGADDGTWQTDPALLDGGLQLALLWTQKALGGHSLPTSVESLTVHRPGLPHGASRVELWARQAHGDKGVCDVLFTDAVGEPIAELRGVTTHVLPGTR